MNEPLIETSVQAYDSPALRPEYGDSHGPFQRDDDPEALWQTARPADAAPPPTLVTRHPRHGHLCGHRRLRQLAGHWTVRTEAQDLVSTLVGLAQWRAFAWHLRARFSPSRPRGFRGVFPELGPRGHRLGLTAAHC